MNIALKVFWANHPMPVDEKINKPDLVLNIPFGNVLVVNSGGATDAPVRSVNNKIGHIVLTATDVGADEFGSANSVKTQLESEIRTVNQLAETNQLNISSKADHVELELTNQKVELNRLALLGKADLTALAMLTALLNTKADQQYVNEQIANLLNSDEATIAAIQEIANALQENEDLLDALEYTVANRVRFDTANQVLTALQKSNARINIGAEESGTAAMLIAHITAQTLGAATAAQGIKADTALQSGDVAPVALSGLFSSLGNQNKIFDVVHSAYVSGAAAAITASDTLGQMLAKLQAQINNPPPKTINWIDIKTIGGAYVDNKVSTSKIEFANIDGYLWVRGRLNVTSTLASSSIILNLNPYSPDWVVIGGDVQYSLITLRSFNGAATASIYFEESTFLNSLRIMPASSAFPSGNFHIPPTCIGQLK